MTGISLALLLVLVFGCLLGLALLLTLRPAIRNEQRDRAARLAEIDRYRVLPGGLPAAVRAPAPSVSTVSTEQKVEDGKVATRTLQAVDRLVRSRGWRARMVEELNRAGLRMRVEEWAVVQVSAVVVGAVVVALVSQNPIGLLPGALAGWLGCRALVRIKATRRVRALTEQLPDTLQLLAGGLRSGFSLNQALGGIVTNGAEPIRGEFARVLTEVRLGAELEVALADMAERTTCSELRWVATAIGISREVGGNLAEVLQTTVGTMRERAGLRRSVDSLTAEGRLSAKILIGLPFLMSVYMLVFRHGYLTPLVTSGIGIAMLVVGVLLLAVGSFWVTRLVKAQV